MIPFTGYPRSDKITHVESTRETAEGSWGGWWEGGVAAEVGGRDWDPQSVLHLGCISVSYYTNGSARCYHWGKVGTG